MPFTGLRNENHTIRIHQIFRKISKRKSNVCFYVNQKDMAMSQSYYMVITANVWGNKELSDSEKILYGHITTLQQKDGVCFASNQYLSDITGVHKNTVGNRINKLKKLGFITVKMTYKKDSNEIEKREIRLSTPINHTVDTPINHTVEDNTTRIYATKQDLEAFESLWKDYTLTFLKRQNRGGGIKSKAKDKYLKLIQKYSSDEIYSFVENHASLKIGHKDLERLLTLELMKQYKEDCK